MARIKYNKTKFLKKTDNKFKKLLYGNVMQELPLLIVRRHKHQHLLCYSIGHH